MLNPIGNFNIDPTKTGNYGVAGVAAALHQAAIALDPCACRFIDQIVPQVDSGALTELIVNIQALDKSITRLAQIMEPKLNRPERRAVAADKHVISRKRKSSAQTTRRYKH